MVIAAGRSKRGLRVYGDDLLDRKRERNRVQLPLKENADLCGRRFPEGRKIQRKDTKFVAGVKEIIAET
jgi:hypothetical protein